jgi:LacI family transcriptional regulator, galactose operon repressor
VKKRSQITLEHIARRLKVSRVTVSKALRGHSDISPEMTKRVHKVAAQLGYTPNIIARSLSSRRSNMIGLVVPKIAHHFFAAVIEAVYDTAFANNYETILTVSQENADREKKHLQTLVAMRVDGIIISISQGTTDMERFRWIKKMGIPLVFVDRHPEPAPTGFSSVLVDDRDGAFRAAEQAIKVGYRTLGFIGGNLTVNIGRNRLQGFKEALKKHGIPVNREWIVPTGYGREDGVAGFKQLCLSKQLPEFVLAATYPVALGIFEAARAMRVRIPEDVDIICFGDSDVGQFIVPSISVVHQPTHELGTTAVRVLLDAILRSETTKPQQIVLPTQLVLRESCTTKRAQVHGPVSVDPGLLGPQVA